MVPLLILAFLVLLIVVFGVIFAVLRPTQSEQALQDRLKMIETSSLPGMEDGAELLREQILSDIPWLNQLLKQIPVCVKLQLFINQSGKKWKVATLLFLTLVLLGVGLWVGFMWLVTWPMAILFAAVVALIPYGVIYRMRAARLARFEEQLPDAVDLIVRGLRAGHTIASAIGMVAEETPDPVAPEFRRIFDEYNFGLPFREAMTNLAMRVPLPDVRFLATAVLVQKETGGNLADVLDKTTTVMRLRFRLKRQLKVYTAQGRLTGYILAAMPFVCFLALRALNPAYIKIMLEDPAGRIAMYIGLGMMVTGALIIRKIINVKI